MESRVVDAVKVLFSFGLQETVEGIPILVTAMVIRTVYLLCQSPVQLKVVTSHGI